MKRAALMPLLLVAAGLPGCAASGGSMPEPSVFGARVALMSIGVTDAQLSGARRIDPRVMRRAPHLHKGAAGAEQCANARLQPDVGNLPAISDATFCLLNAERAARGLTALKPDRRLQRAALLQAGDMVDDQYFAHDGRNGAKLADRIRAAGYLPRGGAWRIGENLASGTGDLATPRAIMSAWMHSAGHRTNILMPHYRQIGVGVIAGNPSARDGAGAGATYVTEFGAVDRPARAASRRRKASRVRR